jgi:hypothetical protein
LDFNFTCGACFVDFDADVGCGSIIPTEDGLYLCRKNPTIREENSIYVFTAYRSGLEKLVLIRDVSIIYIEQGRIQGGGVGAPPPLFWKKKNFWRKIVIFHTKHLPSSRRYIFLSAPPP